MASQKFSELVSRLVWNTKQGKVPWERTSSEEVFQAAFPGYSVRVASEGPDYYLSVYNEHGELVDALSDEEFGDYGAMQRLFENARSFAMGVDDALEEILRNLEPEPPF